MLSSGHSSPVTHHTRVLVRLMAAMVLETLNSVAGHKRKAGAAGLPERNEVDAVDQDSNETSAPPPLITCPCWVCGVDSLRARVFNVWWRSFIKPELEQAYGPAPPEHELNVHKPVSQPISLPDVPSPPILPLTHASCPAEDADLTPLTHGGGLDEDPSCVLTQPMYAGCSCEDCISAETMPIDQFSGSEADDQ